MKRILPIITCGVSLAFCPALRAQDAAPAPATTGTGTSTGAPETHEGHHGGGGPMLQRLTDELGLTADQQNQLKPILETAHQDMRTIHENTSLSDADKRSQMKAARESLNSKIKAILTPDQQTKFDAMAAKWRQGHHGQGGQGNEGGGQQPAPTAAASPAATP